jgi:hypothetical protein
MVKLKLLNPEATSQGDVHTFPVAPRPSTLDGKTVGLLWNDKRGGDLALRRVGQLLQDRFKNVTVIPYQGPRGYPKSLLEQAFEECDVFVGSTGD